MATSLLKGGLVVLAADTGALLRTVVFQYNAETLTRQIGAPAEGAAAVESIRLDVDFDATDALADPERHPQVIQSGIAPMLAALEALVLPAAEGSVRPPRVPARPAAPLVLFVWGRERVQPVRVMELGIVEQAFDRALNPLRARVSLHLRALGAHDTDAGGRAAAMVAAHAQARARLAQRAGVQGLDALGLGKLP